MTSTITVPHVGDWVELKKTQKGSSVLVKGSRWVVTAVNPDKEAIKVSNGRTGIDERIENFYFNEVTPTSQFQKGDIVQHTEDKRFIGRVTQTGKRVKVKWVDGKEDFVEPKLINLFIRVVGGNQEIIGRYAFKEGDRVVVDRENFQGVEFTVKECLPSGQVVVTDADGLDKNFAGVWLSVISNQLSVISQTNLLETDPPRQEEENGQLTLWWNSDEPPEPDDFDGDMAKYLETWQQWETSHPDLAKAIAKRSRESVISNQLDASPVSEGDIDWGDLKKWNLGDRCSCSDSFGHVVGSVEQVFPGKLVILWDGQPVTTEYDPDLIRKMGIHRVEESLDQEQSGIIAITLWQPWATFIVKGIKIHETRSWATNYRGKILIHAAKRAINWNELDIEALEKIYPDVRNWDYPLGAIVGEAELVNCRQCGAVRVPVSESDRLCGNWKDGRFAWELRNIKPLLILDVKGKQGLWKYESVVTSHQSPVTSEDFETNLVSPSCDGHVTDNSNTPAPPNPKDYLTFEEFKIVYDEWVEELWEGDDDLAQAEEQFTSARELWEQCHPGTDEESSEISQAAETEVVKFSQLDSDSEKLAWVDPRLIDVEAGTQTRWREDVNQISLYSEKMTAGEWEWKREPLPELVQDGEKFYVVSGHHRVRAALAALAASLAPRTTEDGEPQDPILYRVYCRITQGTLADAQLLAIRSNANDYHGVPESRADFRNRVEKFFGLLESWDIETQIRELENLKQQPYASEQAIAINQLIGRFQQGKTEEGWSNRIIATYLCSPRSYRTIGNLLTARQAEAVFRSVVAKLSNGDWIRYRQGEEDRIGRIIYLSKTTITVLGLDKTYTSFNLSSPVELLQSIEQVDPIVETTDEEPGQEKDTPQSPIKKSSSNGGGGGGGSIKPKSSVTQELREQAESLGLPTSEEQVLPDTSESDRLRNASPHDVDDRLGATPAPTPQQISNEYLIGFVSNTQHMTQPQIRRALQAIFDWLESSGQTQNLGCLKTVINDL